MGWRTSWETVKMRVREPVIGRIERGMLGLWTVILLTLGVGDTVTTAQGVLIMGGTEVNPFMDAVLSRYGVIGLIIVKSLVLPVIFGVICLQLYFDVVIHHLATDPATTSGNQRVTQQRAAYLSSVVVALMGIGITLNNAYQILAV